MANWNKWIEVVDCIFVHRDKYQYLTDEDKIDSFFIINKKFAKRYPKMASFLNDKSIDKDTAMDIWYDKFKNESTGVLPSWYWTTKSKKETVKFKKDKDYEQISLRYGLNEEEMKFLIRYFKKDLEEELKKIKQYNEDFIE